MEENKGIHIHICIYRYNTDDIGPVGTGISLFPTNQVSKEFNTFPF